MTIKNEKHIQVISQKDVSGKIYVVGDVHAAIDPCQATFDVIDSEDSLSSARVCKHC